HTGIAASRRGACLPRYARPAGLAGQGTRGGLNGGLKARSPRPALLATRNAGTKKPAAPCGTAGLMWRSPARGALTVRAWAYRAAPARPELRPAGIPAAAGQRGQAPGAPMRQAVQAGFAAPRNRHRRRAPAARNDRP